MPTQEQWVKIERLMQYVASDTASKARALAELREILEGPVAEERKERENPEEVKK